MFDVRLPGEQGAYRPCHEPEADFKLRRRLQQYRRCLRRAAWPDGYEHSCACNCPHRQHRAGFALRCGSPHHRMRPQTPHTGSRHEGRRIGKPRNAYHGQNIGYYRYGTNRQGTCPPCFGLRNGDYLPQSPSIVHRRGDEAECRVCFQRRTACPRRLCLT